VPVCDGRPLPRFAHPLIWGVEGERPGEQAELDRALSGESFEGEDDGTEVLDVQRVRVRGDVLNADERLLGYGMRSHALVLGPSSLPQRSSPVFRLS
jgi:hypothetical protein